MLCITLEFPLGVYYAQSGQAPGTPEWPPSPMRLAGALLAAAHARGGHDPAAERGLVQRICEAAPPRIVAPRAAWTVEATEGDAAAIRGPARWAPQNFFRANGRTQAAVEKVGVAIGDHPLRFIWSDVALNVDELNRLRALASDVTFLGTTRSPVIAHVSSEAPDEASSVWVPIEGGVRATSRVGVRVADAETIRGFDLRHELFRSTNGGVQKATMVPATPIGTQVPYALSEDLDTSAAARNPGWWGDMIVIAVDPDRSEIIPRAPAAYLLARAVRTALLGAYEDEGQTSDAPPILRARGSDPHCAIVPLANVWHEHADGSIKGVAVILPSESRVPNLAEQRARVEFGLAQLIRDTAAGSQRFVQVPNSGKIWMKAVDAAQAASHTLNRATYLGPAERWVTISPLVHARWQKRDDGGLLAQVGRDCSHVGLPAPESVEILRGPGRPGGATRPILGERVPKPWRNLLTGPIGHLRITFPTAVEGPILLGKARHFGLGLCAPDARSVPAERRRSPA